MKKEILVKNNGLNLIIFVEKTLLPGVNKVDADIFKQMKERAPHFFDEMEPIIEEVEGRENEESESVDIDSYTARQAKKIIIDTVEMDLLTRWLKETQKEKTRSAIEDQIKKLDEHFQPKEK